MDAWLPLIWTIASLVALWVVARWISAHIQALGWLISGSGNGAIVALWLVLLPGILLHELSHWLVAKLLGLKVKPPDLYPKRRGKNIRLGSVTIVSGGHFRDSLVGMAPFVTGSALILLLGTTVFDLTAIVTSVVNGGLAGAIDGFSRAFQVPDAWLWLYLTFAISNSMFPSPSDSEPVRPVLMFVALLAVLALAAGWTPEIAAESVSDINQVLLVLAEAFTFTLVLDLICGILILVVEFLLGTLRGQRVIFESTKRSR